MGTERQPPDAVLNLGNYSTLDLADIVEDPDSPDGAFGTWDGNGNTDARVSFATPTGNPTVGAALQEFKVWARTDQGSGSNNVDYSFEVWEFGVQRVVLATGTLTAGDTGTLITGTWNASVLSSANGSAVECALIQTSGGSGNPSMRRGLEIGAVEWNVTFDDDPSAFLKDIIQVTGIVVRSR